MIDDLTVIYITFQEEDNIRESILSAQKVTDNILVVDSFSTDQTQNILTEMNIKFLEHEFISYQDKRNWAQKNNPFKTEWVLHLDADENLSPELITWLNDEFSIMKQKFDGFLFSRKTIFLNKFIKFGGQYPNFHLRLFKSEMGYVEDKAYDNHWVLPGGNIMTVRNADIINKVASNLDEFTISHNKWATKQAIEFILNKQNSGEVNPKIFGNPIERKRWFKINIFQKLPLFFRGFSYFLYRYIIKLGFLDGKEGLIFFVLQTFWFRFLVDAKIYELQKKAESSEKSLE